MLHLVLCFLCPSLLVKCEKFGALVLVPSFLNMISLVLGFLCSFVDNVSHRSNAKRNKTPKPQPTNQTATNKQTLEHLPLCEMNVFCFFAKVSFFFFGRYNTRGSLCEVACPEKAYISNKNKTYMSHRAEQLQKKNPWVGGILFFITRNTNISHLKKNLHFA